MRTFVILAAACVLVLHPSAAQPPPPDATHAAKIRDEVVPLVNKERAAKKAGALKVNQALQKAAQGHAENMARQGKLAHVLDGKGSQERARAAGYFYCARSLWPAGRRFG
jgi:uncharacterized protein YkwD